MMPRPMKVLTWLLHCSLWSFAVVELKVLLLWSPVDCMEWWCQADRGDSIFSSWQRAVMSGLPHNISDANFGLKCGCHYMLNIPFILQHAESMLYLSLWKQTLHSDRWGNCASQLPVLSAANFLTRAGTVRIQSKILYLLVSSWAMPFSIHLFSKYKIVTI